MSFQTRIPNLFFLFSGACLVLGFIAPNHYYPWGAFYNEFPVFVALFFFAATQFILARGKARLSLPLMFILAVQVLPIFQLGYGQIVFSGDAWLPFFYLGALALAYHCGNLRSNDTRLLAEGIAWVFVVGALISVFLALSQWLQVNGGIWIMDMPPGGRPYANIAQPNNLATFFFLAIASSLYLRETERIGSAVCGLVVLLLLLGASLTLSRTAVLEAALLSAWVLAKRKELKLKTTPAQIVAALVTYALLLLLTKFAAETLLVNGGGIADRGGQSPERLHMWHILVSAALHQPWFGYGWNQISLAEISIIPHYPDINPILQTDYSHNIALDLILWNGLPIGCVILIGMGWWIYTRLKDCRDDETWFGLGAILMVGVHSLLEYPHAYAYFLLPLGALAGSIDQKRTGWQASLPSKAVALYLVLYATSFFIILREYFVIEADNRLMRYETSHIAPPSDGLTADNILILNQLSEYDRLARTPAREGMSQDELEWMKNVAHRYPYPPALFRYAVALGLNNHPAEAHVELVRLRGLTPPSSMKAARRDWQFMCKSYPKLSSVKLP